MANILLKKYVGKGKLLVLNSFMLKLFKMMSRKVREYLAYCIYLVRNPFIKKQKFLVFAQGRTGSTVLVDLLNSHPDIFCYGEIFEKGVVKKVDFPVTFATSLCSIAKTKFSGFKVKVYQIEKGQKTPAKKFLNKFADDGWKIIYLRRSNFFDHEISDIRSEKTGKYHSVEPGCKESKGNHLIDMSFEEIAKVIEFRKNCYQQELVALDGLDHFSISYEDDLSSAQAQKKSLNSIFEYLGLAAFTVETDFEKVVNKDLSKVIADYGLLEQQILASEYKEYLANR